jgi:dTDP-4-dehydrorhamnose reductase
LILVFGAGGQLARELDATARAEGVALTGVSKAETDITDAGAVMAAFGRVAPTVVVNAAAYNLVDRAEGEPDQAMRANALGPAILAVACAHLARPLIHISTDYVFDGAKAGAYVEEDPVAPLGAYGRSKAAGEQAVRETAAAHLIIRTAWLYGVYGSNFLKAMVKLAAEREEIDVVADQRGSPTATGDLAIAILGAAKAIAAGQTPWGTYHFAGRGEATRHAFASRIVAAQSRFTGRAPAVNPVPSAAFPTPAARPKNSVLDSSRFTAVFGIAARDWREAVDATVADLFAAGAAP